MKKEEWATISNYEGKYQVINMGRIKSLSRIENGFTERILNPVTIRGYRYIGLSTKGKTKLVRVHRLVAIHFIPNPVNKPTVNHKNGIKYDNRVDNLEWATCGENNKHAIDTGLKKVLKGESVNNAMLSNAQALEIFNSKEDNNILSSQYNVSVGQIRAIKRGSRWSSITGKHFNSPKKREVLSAQEAVNIFKSNENLIELAKKIMFHYLQYTT